MIRVRHSKVDLAVHELRGGSGPTLLLLHGLAERTPDTVPAAAEGWPGPVLGLDFTGHGDSTVPAGGGYTAEVLMGDVDVTLAETGPATVLGRGLGAYVGLLIAGARPDLVRGTVLDDGPGLAGGGEEPGSTTIITSLPDDGGPPDPYALLELSRDLRPADYATTYVRLALAHSGLDEPITVAARFRPPWLAAVAAEPGVADRRVAEALTAYGELAGG